MATTMTEEEVKRIAKAAAKKQVEVSMQTLIEKLDNQNKLLANQGDSLAMISRLLLGEEGVTAQEDVFYHGLKNVNDWYKRWDKPQPGCNESYFQKLGKMISLYDKLKWLFGIIVGATVLNIITIVERFFEIFT